MQNENENLCLLVFKSSFCLANMAKTHFFVTQTLQKMGVEATEVCLQMLTFIAKRRDLVDKKLQDSKSKFIFT